MLLEAKKAGVTVHMETNVEGDSDNSIDINDLLDNDNGNDSDLEAKSLVWVCAFSTYPVGLK